jgi:hypothetical protein
MKETVLYQETYRNKAARLRDDCLPVLPSATLGFTVVEAYIEKAGAVSRTDGTRLEFQVVRIYLKADGVV